MAELTINQEHWDKLKLKVKRKYRDLTDDDLSYQPGQEDELIQRLMTRLKRNREYVVFTLQTGLQNLHNNRL